MNIFEHATPQQREARLKYLDADFQIMREGDFVRCAATGDPIRVENLRYWNVARQMPYKSAAAAFAAYLDAFR